MLLARSYFLLVLYSHLTLLALVYLYFIQSLFRDICSNAHLKTLS